MVTEFTFTDFRCRGAIVVMFYPKIPPFNLAAEEVKACPVQRIWHVNVVEHQVVFEHQKGFCLFAKCQFSAVQFTLIYYNKSSLFFHLYFLSFFYLFTLLPLLYSTSFSIFYCFSTFIYLILLALLFVFLFCFYTRCCCVRLLSTFYLLFWITLTDYHCLTFYARPFNTAVI